ncbi:Outer membrane protein TolC [Chitinophaga sp. YR573]|uniref:TolC family protein n=1 Tax=Chitinophaga sp. YR573 TaxID=1881040 RepID=UPI0008B19921|nr:TolC family protein [Chitinophaga sp. YR573]SEW46526.1 Outer membrane protein TolC [Chitinophaga sp. YR573]
MKHLLIIIAGIIFPFLSSAQMRLSLNDALQMAKQKNKYINMAQSEQEAVNADAKDARNAELPQIGINGNYQRFSKVRLYEDGLTNGHNVERRPEPNNANLGADAAVTIFAGGKFKTAIKEQDIKKDIASLNTLDQTGIVSLQVISAYLDIIRLNDQDSLIGEQLKRAQTRLKNIQVLFDNQKVTRSDLLRAQLNLSNQQLSREQTENDISIAMTRMAVILNLPQQTQFLPTDSVSGTKPDLADLLNTANAYPILKAKQNILLQENRIKAIKANNSPTLQAYSAYGLNYPNYLGFPPVNQFYLLGFVGVKMQYNISSLYHNKYKQQAAKIRLSTLETQQSAIEDNVNQEVNALSVKYGESLNRIKVAEESIVQASANYKIVSAKYFNQLALLTDLLDADNLYLESRYNLIKSQTDALAFYYRLLYTTGKL